MIEFIEKGSSHSSKSINFEYVQFFEIQQFLHPISNSALFNHWIEEIRVNNLEEHVGTQLRPINLLQAIEDKQKGGYLKKNQIIDLASNTQTTFKEISPNGHIESTPNNVDNENSSNDPTESMFN